VNARRAILDALLRFGSRTIARDELAALPPFFVVPTDAGTDVGELFEHQREAVSNLRKRFRREAFATRGLVVMPTGSGKTRTAVHWLLDDIVAAGHKVLWVTHRTELMDQTARAFIAAAPLLARRKKNELTVRLIGGGYSPGTTVASDAHDVAIASVQTLAYNHGALAKWLKDHTRRRGL
jgi:superfamily II DNA or RNA helicase